MVFRGDFFTCTRAIGEDYKGSKMEFWNDFGGQKWSSRMILKVKNGVSRTVSKSQKGFQ